MPIAIRPAHPVNDDEIVELSRRNPTLRFERTPQGALIVAPLIGSAGSSRNMELALQLAGWNARTRLGRAFDSSGGFSLPTSALYAPDASWVAQERWEMLTLEQREGFAPLCPDAVFELRSKSDRHVRLLRKLVHYVDAGAKLAVLIDPYQRTVHALFGGSHEVHVFRDPGTLRFVSPDGLEVLPGFELDAKAIFETT